MLWEGRGKGEAMPEWISDFGQAFGFGLVVVLGFYLAGHPPLFVGANGFALVCPVLTNVAQGTH